MRCSVSQTEFVVGSTQDIKKITWRINAETGLPVLKLQLDLLSNTYKNTRSIFFAGLNTADIINHCAPIMFSTLQQAVR